MGKPKSKTETVSISIPLDSLSGSLRLARRPSPFPKKKRELEVYIANEFTKFLAQHGISCANIKPSPDDSHGRPDVLATIDGAPIGIQVTEFRIAHRPNAELVARRLAEKLIGSILQRVEPPFPVLVNIYTGSDSQNAVPRMTTRALTILADAISQGIAHGLTTVKGTSRTDFWRVPLPKVLAGNVSSVSIDRLPTGHLAYGPTRGNLSLTFHFHSVAFSESRMLQMAREIAAKKARSTADVLIVWYRDSDFWGKGEKMAAALAKAVAHVPSKASFLLAFDDFGETKTLYWLKARS